METGRVENGEYEAINVQVERHQEEWRPWLMGYFLCILITNTTRLNTSPNVSIVDTYADLKFLNENDLCPFYLKTLPVVRII